MNICLIGEKTYFVNSCKTCLISSFCFLRTSSSWTARCRRWLRRVSVTTELEGLGGWGALGSIGRIGKPWEDWGDWEDWEDLEDCEDGKDWKHREDCED